MVSGWFKWITFIVHFISIIIKSAPPQIIRHQIPEVRDACYRISVEYQGCPHLPVLKTEAQWFVESSTGTQMDTKTEATWSSSSAPITKQRIRSPAACPVTKRGVLGRLHKLPGTKSPCREILILRTQWIWHWKQGKQCFGETLWSGWIPLLQNFNEKQQGPRWKQFKSISSVGLTLEDELG